MFWLNVDIPTKIWKLHCETCRFGEAHESKFKGIEEMRRDGGWFKFNSFEEAYQFYKEKGSNQNWQPCKICNPVSSE